MNQGLLSTAIPRHHLALLGWPAELPAVAMHRVVMGIFASRFQAWRLRQCLEWFGARAGRLRA